MKPLIRSALILSILLASAHRLPAPVDDADRPTTSPEQQAKPKIKKSKPKRDEEPAKSKPEAPAKPRPSGVARNLSGPSPPYPPEAAAQQLSGKGQYLLHFDQATGNCVDVTVVQSAGSPILDQASITAFRQWHEDPNCAKEVTMSMTFTKQGAEE